MAYQVVFVRFVGKRNIIDVVQHLVGTEDGGVVFPVDLGICLSEVIIGKDELGIFVQFRPSGIADAFVGHAYHLCIDIAGPCSLAVEHAIYRYYTGLNVGFRLPVYARTEGVLILQVEQGRVARREQRCCAA